MEFKNTSEYAYLSALCELQSSIFQIFNTLSEEQQKKILPSLNRANDVTNASRDEL